MTTYAHHKNTYSLKKDTETVDSVLLTVIEQLLVLRLAAICTSLTIACVAVRNGTSIKNHAVPSFAIAQSTEPLGAGYGKNKFNTLAVFGVAV